MAKAFSGENPSQLYLDIQKALLTEGDEVGPRGKKTKELRPVIIENTNPMNRVVFVEGRKVNPFFQQAEALWILAGRSDVEWLLKYNKNMGQFSDDGINFNAPYGERLRYWNKSNANDYIYNPIDQLVDVYEKIVKDTYTRQAVAVIYNPLFDNMGYGGKDTPCNLILTFKVRPSKRLNGADALDLTVFNRSNDLHWGTFGANLCQFATIQEVMASWLGLPVGKYSVCSDSLHIYLEDYGAAETNKILKAYHLENANLELTPVPKVKHFTFEDEPRITTDINDTFAFLHTFFNGGLSDALHHDNNILNEDAGYALLNAFKEIPDAYFRDNLLNMLVYRAHRLGNFDLMVDAIKETKDSQWKLSGLYFLYSSYKDKPEFTKLYAHFSEDKQRYIERKKQRLF